MDTQLKIDTLDEALRIIYLEHAKDANLEVSNKEIEIICTSKYGIALGKAKKNLLIESLHSILRSQSFGQLVLESMNKANLDDVTVSQRTALPIETIQELKEDRVYTNNIPILLLKNLISTLDISFDAARSAIRKTFEILQNPVLINKSSWSNLSPSHRLGHHDSINLIRNSYRTDGKELFQNKESLEKYLSRLDELMNIDI